MLKNTNAQGKSILSKENIIYSKFPSDLPYCAPRLKLTAANVSYWKVRLNVRGVKLNKNTHARTVCEAIIDKYPEK